MSRNIKDITTIIIITLLSLLTGGLYFYLWLLIKYLREEV